MHFALIILSGRESKSAKDENRWQKCYREGTPPPFARWTFFKSCQAFFQDKTEVIVPTRDMLTDFWPFCSSKSFFTF